MSAGAKSSVFVSQYIRNLRGGSQPILVQASDGQHYVVKFTNNLQGANLPFNESIGNELYRACGLVVPSWKPLFVSDTFLDQNQDCWIQTPEGRLRPNSGPCFGSRFLGGEGIRLLEILPGNSFKRIRNLQSFWLAWLIDICSQHADNRQAIFQEDAKGRLNAFFVDHGHMFGGPKGELAPRFQASHYLDFRIYHHVCSKHLLDFQKIAGSLNVEKLWRQIQELPDDWKTTSALNRFTLCLDRLSTPSLVQNILDTMVDAQQKVHGCGDNNPQSERKPPISLLCPCIQTARLEQSLVERGYSRIACR
jgi:hypothetical protein